MKNIIRNSCMALAAGALMVSCKKFDQVNVNPIAADSTQVQIEYFINNSIIGAQQNPDVAERSFVLYWKVAAHQSEDEGLSQGYYDDGWTSAYYNQVAGWLNSVNTGIQIGEQQLAAGQKKVYTENLIQVARIWRAYLMAEMSDIFGPIPVDAFKKVNPQFSDVKTVYYFLLDELKDASGKLDLAVVNPNGLAKEDPAYGYDYAKWRKFANSERMRLAMRLSEVDAAKAQSEFEAAAAGGDFITDASESFKVQEKPGWDALSGVMSREWNPQFLSPTLYNLYIGLGGVKSEDQVGAALKSFIKPADWMGVKYANHFATMTNNPSAGYWFDGLPNTIDPRAYKAFIIPGDFTNPNFSSYPSWTTSAKTTTGKLLNDDGSTFKEIDAKYTWNAGVNGDWGKKGSRNPMMNYFEGTVPRLSQAFRGSTSQRIFFAGWESYFLVAEAGVRGWAIPMTAKAAYEAGITKSFEYWGVPLGTYLTSDDYNRVGTSVSWEHTAEPPATYSMKYKDGYTGTDAVATISYPKNDLYKSGAVRNDLLTKIITQKYIAQVPWQPLEAWSDQRRLGLPFFENPAIETALPNLTALTAGNYMTSNVKFFPQRIKYPSDLKNTNAEGYKQATGALGGDDGLFTPLWWAKK